MRRFLAFASALAVFLGATALGTWAVRAAYDAGRSTYAGWEVLARAYQEIRLHYVEELPDERLLRGAIRGMVALLDRHSAYLDPEAYAEAQERAEGGYPGIGARVAPDPRGLRVTAVYPDSPAEAVGLRRGDLLLAVDGKPLEGLSYDEAAGLLLGPRGTAVSLAVEHPDGQRETHALQRDWVHVPLAWGQRDPRDLGWAALSHFQPGAARELRALLDRLEQRGPLRGLVLDLRGNPGGLLDEAVAVVDLFVGDALVARTHGRGPGSDEEYRAHDEPDDRSYPLVVLVDGGSASGAELVAGALRDLRGAPLVGTPTYGKGSVQSFFAFEDGSALKLTISRYLLPNGESLDEQHGLQPDVLVYTEAEQRYREAVEALERQLASAELDEEGRARLQQAIEGVASPPPPPGLREYDPRPLDEVLAGDPQLVRALDELDRLCREAPSG